MPRPKRHFIPGEIYHVVNRGNDKRVIFPGEEHFDRFLHLLVRGRRRANVDIVGFSLMATHFHLLLRPRDRGAIPSFMHWVSGVYAVDFRNSTETAGFGHVFQRRYFSKAVEDHLGCLTVLGYIEMNALEAREVSRAEDWQWCSLFDRSRPRSGLATYDLIRMPTDWVDMVNQPWEQFILSLVRFDLDERRCRRST